MTRLAGVSRYDCPLGCGWFHEESGADLSDPTASHPFATTPPAPTGVDPVAWGFALGSLLATEAALRAHFGSHSLVEWVLAVNRLNGELASARAERERLAEAVRNGLALAAERLGDA